MAAITSAGSGAWSSAGTWTGGVPVSGDTVTIQAGHTVTFDVNQSGFAPGLAVLTINGTLEASTTPGSYYLKMAGNITASSAGGILRAGSSGTPYPSDCVFTIYLNGNYQINCHASNYLTLQLYCYDPPVKYARLISATPKAITGITLGSTTTITCTGHGYSVGNTVWLQDIGGTTELNDRFFEVATVPTSDTFTIRWPDPDLAVNSTDYTAYTSGGIVCPQTAEASSQTQIEIDEDVSGDAEWTRAGALVRIDNINRANQSEAYTISSVSSGYLTLSSGLTNSKLSGSLAILATRNVRINSSGTAISNGMIRYGTSHILRCEIRPGSSSTDGVREAINSTISGPLSGCNNGVNSSSGHTISGPVSGCNNGVILGSGHTVSGPVSGCAIGISSGSGHTVSGLVSGCNYAVNSGTAHTVSGPVSGCNYGIYSGTAHTISGPVSGCASGVNSGSGHTVSGPVSGCASGIVFGSGHTISGSVFGCTNGINSGTAHTISGPVSECTYGILFGSGHTISGPMSGCTNGIYSGTGYKLNSATFVGNTNDINAVPDFIAYNILFGGATEFANYLSVDRNITAFAESVNHDQIANEYRAWCRGGYVQNDESTVYTGRDRSYEHVCESADFYVFRNYTVTVDAGGGLVVQCYVRKDASMSYLPRLWALLPGEEPFISGSPSYEAVMTNSVDTWETLTLVYANNTSGPVQLTVRTLAKNASGSVFFDPIITVLAPATYDVYGTLLANVAAILADTNELQGDWVNGGRLDLILDARASQSSVDTIDGIVDDILTDTGTTIPAQVAALNDLSQADVRSAVGLAAANLDTQLDALPTAAENRAEMDSNSTQLAAIVADTGTDGVVISTATAQAIADAVLSRGVDNVEDSASVASLAEIILAILESSRTSTTWTIRKTDGTTFGTRTLTLDGDAEPVTGVT